MTESAAPVVRISKANAERLDVLSGKTGRTKTYYANKALEAYLEDVEDYGRGIEALRSMKRRYSVEEIAAEFDLAGGVRGQRAKRSEEAGSHGGSADKAISGGAGRAVTGSPKSRRGA